MLVVMFGWVLFKLENVPDTLAYIGAMFGRGAHGYTEFSARFYLDNKMAVLLVIGILASVPWKEILKGRALSVYAGFTQSAPDKSVCIIRRILLIVLFLLSMLFIVNSTYNPFIYFRF